MSTLKPVKGCSHLTSRIVSGAAIEAPRPSTSREAYVAYLRRFGLNDKAIRELLREQALPACEGVAS